jgi:ankyrin repeat protein
MKNSDLFDMLLLHESEKFMKEIEKIENINFLNKTKANLLQKALSEKLFLIAKELINRGINLNNQDINGMTALHYLSDHFDLGMAKLLLEKGADVNIKDKHGNNPLWYSLSNNKCIELTKLFVSAGADIYSKNLYGKSVFDKTLKYEGEELVRVKELLGIE